MSMVQEHLGQWKAEVHATYEHIVFNVWKATSKVVRQLGQVVVLPDEMKIESLPIELFKRRR